MPFHPKSRQKGIKHLLYHFMIATLLVSLDSIKGIYFFIILSRSNIDYNLDMYTFP